MSDRVSAKNRPTSIELIEQAASGRPPLIERMPRQTFRRMVAMRDGCRLATWVWLPSDREGPYPTILLRTPYQEHSLGWARLGTERYLENGYAVVFQVIRGIGESEGNFSFNNPLDRTDGYDTIAWIAAQPWCTGAVGMDGSSYVGMTQVAAAMEQPPALRCIVPAVVSLDFFNHVPRYGGIVSRQHTLGWTQFLDVDDLRELVPGLWGPGAFLSSPAAWSRLVSRPMLDSVEGVLDGVWRQHFTDVMTHDRFDEWWAARTFSPADYARIDVPVMVVTGLFDGSMGSQYLWTMLERHAPRGVERHLVIGPWDHGQAYVGGSAYGPYRFQGIEGFDLQQVRLAFFDKHLKGEGHGPRLPGRVSSYLLGRNDWIGGETYPDPQVTVQSWYLGSDGLANLRGHGTLMPGGGSSGAPSDSFESDPSLPFVPVAASIMPELVLDLRETERQEDVLVYTSPPLEVPLCLHGEFAVELFVAADVPDCDFVCWLAHVPPDGRTTQIALGQLRLRYRDGFDKERLVEPGECVRVSIAMTHAGIELAPGERLRLLIGATRFPMLDPNPHDGGSAATAKTTRKARQTVFHDSARPSRVLLPERNVAA